MEEYTLKEEFMDWMIENIRGKKSAGKYADAITTLLNLDMIDRSKMNYFHLFNEMIDSVFNNIEFIEKDTKGNRMYSVAIKHYKSFLESEFNTNCIPEEVQTNKYYEGHVKTITVNLYERNSKARKQCLDKYGYKCAICGFDSEKVYGEKFKNKIHVHHKKALSEIGEEYEVNGEEHLIPVCPNCHMIIHLKENGTYDIEEMKTFIEGNRNK